jgi:hypothetical protein
MNEKRHSLEVRPFYRTLFQFQKRGRLKLLTGVIVSQQVTRTVCKKRSIFFFKMLELDKEVFYNLDKKDKKVVLVYDSDQEREILDLGLDIEPGPIVETFSSKERIVS